MVDENYDYPTLMDDLELLHGEVLHERDEAWVTAQQKDSDSGGESYWTGKHVAYREIEILLVDLMAAHKAVLHIGQMGSTP
jgi:hypothetical protein